jgi:RHS repeat-associated protein
LRGNTYHVLAVRRGGAWYWYANDHLPTPRKLVNASGTVVWDGRMEPFGTTDEVVATVEQALRFPGQVGDPTIGIVLNDMRWYSPTGGRYLQGATSAARPRLSALAGLGSGWTGPSLHTFANHFATGRGAWSPFGYALSCPVIHADAHGSRVPTAPPQPPTSPKPPDWKMDCNSQLVEGYCSEDVVEHCSVLFNDHRSQCEYVCGTAYRDRAAAVRCCNLCGDGVAPCITLETCLAAAGCRMSPNAWDRYCYDRGTCDAPTLDDLLGL